VPPTLAEVLREHWPAYARANRKHLCAAHHRAARCALACRGPEMGGRLYRCDCSGCHRWHYAYHSCNHRSCPGCGAREGQVWTAKQEAKLLPAPYFMVTFTVPAELRPLCKAHPKELCDLVMKESAGALKDVVATKLGGEPGFTSVLHTWGRQKQHHPHVHIIVPAVAFDRVAGRLAHPAKAKFLVHYRPLADRFRTRMRAALQERHPGLLEGFKLDASGIFAPDKKWVCNVKAVGRGATALRYLARYVGRGAFHPKQLLGYNAAGQLLLSWTSSQTGKRGVLRLHPHEFIRRWLLHVLPKGFTRVRHYGFLSSAAKRTRLKVRALLGEFGEPPPQLPELEPFTCTRCGGALRLVREIPRPTRPRGPPTSKIA
jgi:hypothetical protein